MEQKRSHRALEVVGLPTLSDEIFVSSWGVLQETCRLHNLPVRGNRSEILRRLVKSWTPPIGCLRKGEAPRNWALTELCLLREERDALKAELQELREAEAADQVAVDGPEEPPEHYDYLSIFINQ